ncbi:plasma-membrane proton-e [Coemansia reversa NRRL 1564]|uniref:Plasma membrane ATPase n=1 Tax=Coemansia reversa (strain ATCC 12441 / NRRL 1564) TaxID=763665 RepID=A0A2G5BE20_COERN|nr:plasma-membrane proton-e [Coemansia reversa NRRL 1564]|eukprot:PIA17266.1 plasma-membrane proton-e [Coemansia reversa NRRL 1564]
MSNTPNDTEKVEKEPVSPSSSGGVRSGSEDMTTLNVDASKLTVADLYDKEKFDLETLDNKLVFHLLQAGPEGLTQAEATARIEKFGPNKLPEKKVNPIMMFLSFMWNPLSWVMEAAAIVAIALSNGQGMPPDWQDFVGIILLLLGNSCIGFYEERGAGKAVEALMAALAPQCKVKRDGKWETMEACNLVPGDIIAIGIGDVVPADSRMVVSNGVKIDQAALTGESLPVGKDVGDEAFSGSTVKQGEAEALVIGTGLNTFFGRAASLVAGANEGMGHLQQVLAKIGNFCICSIAIFLVAEIFVMFPGYRFRYRRGINNLLVLLIGGIPIAMPTVLSVTLAIGAKQLAEHKAIVTRISAIEELAGVTILCSDKTGTLTLNELTIKTDAVKQYSDVSVDEILLWSAYASRVENQDAIDKSVVGSLPNPSMAREGIDEMGFQPFNPVDKRTEITFRRHSDGTVHRVTKGMSQVILELSTKNMSPELENQLHADVDEFARRGLRALAVAEEDVPSGELEGEGSGFRLIGLLPIFDPPRHDTKETIDRAIDLGVHVKMVTGDQLAIAKETGRELGMGDTMYKASILNKADELQGIAESVDELVLRADGFAGVYPEHKYEIVERLQKLGHMVAMTGDGVNDAPALAKANVGVAVADASDAARSAADIVLTEAGLSTIIEAFMHSRVIFQRMRNYSIYTCAVTIRVVTTFSILVFAFKFDFPPFMVLILAIINDGTMMTISTDRVKPSRHPNAWNLVEIFSYAIVYGCYLTLSTLIFFVVVDKTNFFQRHGCKAFTNHNDFSFHSVIYLQVSILSQALIFVTRAQGFFFAERPSIFLMCAFVVAQLVATMITVYANWGFTEIYGSGWHWAGAVWIWDIVWFMPLDFIKFGMAGIIQRFAAHRGPPTPGAPVTHEQVELARQRTRMSMEAAQSVNRISTIPSRGASYYAPNMQDKVSHSRNFGSRVRHMITKTGKSLGMDNNELRRLQSTQAQAASRVLSNKH